MNLLLVRLTCACLLLTAACARSRPSSAAAEGARDAGEQDADGANRAGAGATDPSTTVTLPGAVRATDPKDASGTSKPPDPTQARCGDGIRQSNEVCDGSQLSGSCQSLGYAGGTLNCSSLCNYDTSMCVDSNGSTGGTGSGGMGGGGTRG